MAKLALGLASLLMPIALTAQPGVPNVFNPNETEFQHETHFLAFPGGSGENAASATAYYKAINPSGSKTSFPQWLVNAGFIGDASQWHTNGTQNIVTGQPAGVYGDNVVNADTHVIVLNAADLGFVRNQFIRCKPSCSAKNPTIYTYLENYPVAPFAVGGSNFGSGGDAYPTDAEAAAAMASAITRPLGVLGGDGASPCNGSAMCIERIADVAFEWAPAETNPTSTSRYGQLYAYVFFHDGSGITETINATPPQIGKPIVDYSTKTMSTIVAGDKFPPNLDGLGFKPMPGLCLICHGGAPIKSLSAGAYPNGGKISGFRFLPIDTANMLFGDGPLSLAAQEPQIKRYNQDVLMTVSQGAESDGQVKRPPHVAQLIHGWYAPGGNYSDDQSMSGTTQNDAWIPPGWREAPYGTAPAGSEHLYLEVVGPTCRSCHLNREISLDFGTAANLLSKKGDVTEYALLPQCKSNHPAAGAKFMPLAHLTFQRYFETQAVSKTLFNGLVLAFEPDTLAAAFGYGSVQGYCATNP
ncbi:MAG TPA: hypothetical protein VGL22_16680 [Terracidiphilus sp.]